MDKKAKPQKQKKPYKPKKISERYLRNAGLHYLKRYTTSTEHFRTIMMRKIHKSCKHHPDQELEACQALLQQAIDYFIEMGFLNDAEYTRGMVISLRRRGLSHKGIHAKLAQKRLPRDLIQSALADIDAPMPDAEYQAALTHARKKRLGPYALRPPEDADKAMQRALGSFARAGFSYDIAKKILSATDD